MKKLSIILLAIFFSLSINSQTTSTYTSGTTVWTVPACVTSITVQAWGGGGGGGGTASKESSCSSCSYVEACSAGGGGGGGGFVSRVYAVTPGETYTITVGAGGAAGPGSSSSSAACNGGNGGNSIFTGPATAVPGNLIANGGSGGGGALIYNNSGFWDHQGTNGAGGTGGTGSGYTTMYQGGSGATGMHSASCWDLSAGGGGGAGSTANGGNATTLVCYGSVAGGTGGASGGGNGGNGKADSGTSTQSYNGNSGSTIGGGGGGGLIHMRDYYNQWITTTGGAGARGEVRILYNTSSPGITATSSTSLSCTSSTAQAAITYTNGSTAFTWSGPGIVSGSGTGTVTVNASGVYSYTASVGGCNTTGTISVASNIVLPTVTASSNTLTCVSTTVQTIASTASSPVSYNWSGPGIVSGATSASATVNSPGTYNYTVTNTSNGCQATGSVSVAQNTVNPDVSSNVTGTLTCISTSGSIDLYTTATPVTYTWSGPGIVSGNGTPTITVNTGGTYNYTVTNTSNGCKATGSAAITQNTTAVSATASASSTLTCNTSTTQATISTASSPVSYNWSGPGIVSGNGTASITVNSSGVYSYTVTNTSNGCNKTGTVSVTQNTTTPTIASASGNTLTCTNTTVNTVVSSASSPISYNWSGPGIVSGATSASATVNSPGTYNYTVTNTTSGCTTTGSVSVAQNTVNPDVSSNVNGTLTCASTSGSIDLYTTATPVTYTWSGPGIVSGNGTPTITVNTSGVYSYTTTITSTGCKATGTVAITQNTVAPTASVSPSSFSTTCASPTVQLSASGSSGSLTYSWTPPATGSLNNNTISNPIANGYGTFTVVATDPTNGCTSAVATASISADVNTPTVSLSASSLTLNCSVTSQTVSVSSSISGLTYSWTPSPTSGQGTSNPGFSSPGSYSVVVTNTVNGCSTTANVAIASNTVAPTIATATSNTLTCSSTTAQSVVSTTTTPVSVSWSGPGVVSGATSNTVVVNAGGAYSYTVTNTGTGCSSSGVVSVSQNTVVPTLTLSPSSYSTTCGTPTVQVSVSGSSGSLTYSWTPPATGSLNNNTISNPIANGSGVFTVTATDPANGCSSDLNGVTTLTIVADVNTPTVSLSAASLTLDCSHTTQTVSVSSTISDLTYSWSPNPSSGQGTTSPTFDTPGSYSVVVTNTINGCSSSANISVAQNTVNPDVSSNVSGTLTCSSTTGTIDLYTTATPVTYNWSGPSIVSGNGTPTITIDMGGAYQYTVTDNTSGCSSSGTVSVTQNTVAPTLTLSSVSYTTTCASPTVQLSVNGTPSGLTYTWTSPATGSLDDYSIANPVANGSGIFTVTATDPTNGCVSTDALVTITPDANTPTVSLSASDVTLTCSSSTQTITASSTQTDLTYSWTPAPSSGQGTDSPVFNNPGTYVGTITNTVNGCSSNATITVSSNTLSPTFASIATSASSQSVITCSNASLSYTANASGGSNVSWTGPSGPLVGNPVNISAAGDYTVTATDPANGCSVDSVISVSTNTIAPSLSSASSSADSLNCANPAVSFSAASTGTNVSYTWSGPNGYASNNQNPTGINIPGSYTLTVLDTINGCSTSTVLAIVQGTNPAVSFTANPLSGNTPLSVDFGYTGTGGFNGLSWTFGNGQSSSNTNPSTIYNLPGTYTVMLVGIGGANACNDTATTVITVLESDMLEIPNVFTPNGDGTNDVFFIHSKGYVDMRVEIYNRWGQLLHIMEGVNSTWDGKAPNREIVPDGTYYFLLTATRADDKTVTKTGYITLLR